MEEIVEDWPPLTDEDKVVIRRHAKRIESWTRTIDGYYAGEQLFRERMRHNTEIDQLYDITVRLKGKGTKDIMARMRWMAPDAIIRTWRHVDKDDDPPILAPQSPHTQSGGDVHDR